jgi:hypothetical protein
MLQLNFLGSWDLRFFLVRHLNNDQDAGHFMLKLPLAVYGPTYRVSFLVCAGMLAGSVISIAVTGFLMGDLWKRKSGQEQGYGSDSHRNKNTPVSA